MHGSDFSSAKASVEERVKNVLDFIVFLLFVIFFGLPLNFENTCCLRKQDAEQGNSSDADENAGHVGL